MDTTIRFVYITAPDLNVAKKLGHELVESRLAACVNIIERMHSIYWWQGKIEEANEVVIVAKTRQELVPQLIQKIETAHPYDTPCALSFEIQEGTSKYIQWLINESDPEKTQKRS